MCELTRPAPGLVLDLLHPNDAWPFLALALVVWGVLFARICYSKPGAGARMTRTTALRLGLAAGACMLLTAAYMAFIGWPSDVLRRAWLAQQEAALSPACVSAAVDPANNAALYSQGVLFLLLAFVPWCAAIILFVIALKGRGLKLNGW